MSCEGKLKFLLPNCQSNADLNSASPTLKLQRMESIATPIPKSKGHWLIGDMRALVANPLNYIIAQRPKFGDMFQADTLMHKVVFAAHPDVAKHLLLDNHKNYYKSFDYEILKLVLGEGLIGSDGEFWRKQRRLAQPAFHKKRIEGMFAAMLEESEKMVARWESYKGSGKSLELNTEMTAVTVNIVAKTLFGTHVDTSMEAIGKSIALLNGYISARINNPLMPPPWVPTARNLQFKRDRKTLDDIIYKIIADRRQHPSEHDDLLAMLMSATDDEGGEGMTDLQLRDEILTLFLAGHETSATSLTWMLILLSQNPEAMARAKKEATDVLGQGRMQMEDLGKLPYLRRVIDEGLRLYPPAWIVGRKALEDDVIHGFAVPKGYNVIVSTYLIHRHPDFWENPDKFDPDRFLPERVNPEQHKYAYFPFGGGPRMCIGNSFALMEMTILLALILQKFDPRAGKQTWEMNPMVTLRIKGDVPFFV
jgi:cytochrome P450